MTKDKIEVNDVYEARRIIKLLQHDVQEQYKGKRFWFWVWVFSITIAPIIVEFLQGVLKGLS